VASHRVDFCTPFAEPTAGRYTLVSQHFGPFLAGLIVTSTTQYRGGTMRNSMQIHARWRRAIAVVTLLMMAAVSVVASQPKQSEMAKKPGAGDLVAEVLRSPRAANEIRNLAGAPVTILDSSSLEISRSVYRKLTGMKTSAAQAASYPQITLVNNSDSPVTQVLLLLTNKLTGARNRLKIGNIKINPRETFVVDSEKWMIPALVGVRSAEDQPKTISRNQVLRYDSSRVWMLGSAADLSVTVGLVDQADGTRWDLRQRIKTSAAPPMRVDRLSLRPVAYHPSAAAYCSCAGTVICFGDGGWYCWGECYDCTLEDCAICAIFGCTITCIILME
jgi:hypothetical protein